VKDLFSPALVRKDFLDVSWFVESEITSFWGGWGETPPPQRFFRVLDLGQ